jgi:glycosyltransferase involved in cell wall biosynthesis
MSRKRVLIDGYNLALEAGTGVATYARNLSRRLHELDHEVHVLYGMRGAPSDPLLREVAFFDTGVRKRSAFGQWLHSTRGWFASALGARPQPVPVTGKVVLRHLQDRLPYFDRLWNSPDLFARATSHHRYFFERRLTVTLDPAPSIAHWTYPLPLRIAGATNIYTLHDLVPLRLPYTTLDVKRHYLRLVRMLAARADHIVTVSENSRRDIVNLLGVPEDKVTNTYQAVDLPRQYTEKSEDLVRREIEGGFNLFYKDYFLFFGAIEPKKNISRLIEAYLGSRVQSPLVIVGKAAWKSEEELKLLSDELTLERRRVIRIDYAPLSLLISLIRGAKALLFPSLYEGFGLPVLEAMMLGTPVLTSRESSLPEVAGDAALYVDPYNPDEIAEGVRTLEGNEELCGELAAKGRKQAALFSAENYRKRLAELYQRLG